MKPNIEKIKNKKTIKQLLEFGIININKPSGPTSFNTSDFVRKKLNLKKTSHFGTLDPKVTGVLPIALNRACKLTGFFLSKEKEYVGIMRIHKKIPTEEIKKIIKEKFTGKIMQKPPVKSRVKRQERQREILKFQIIETQGQNILFKVKCQAGTYIRKLISDLGESLNIGAHMLELRRTKASVFSENDKDYPSVDLYEFKDAIKKYKQGDESHLKKIITPAEIISKIYPTIKIKKDNLKKILTGRPIHNEDIITKNNLNKEEIICVFSKDQFIGMYEVTKGEYTFAKPKFVLQPLKINSTL